MALTQHHTTLTDMKTLSTLKAFLSHQGIKLAFLFAIALFLSAVNPAKADEISGKHDQLENLFGALAETQNLDDAERLTVQIWQIWITNNGDETSVDMMYRGINFMDTGNLSIAEAVFSKIIDRDPGYTEAWNKRATVRYLLNNLRGSEADIYEVLVREPRHFGAMSGLGLIKMQQGKLKEALVIYKDILKIHPNSPDATQMVPRLKSILKGDPA